MPDDLLAGRRVLLGVTGGIAAYKSVDLARALVRAGSEVQAVMTSNARRFLGALTLRTVTGRPVATRFFTAPDTPLPHIALARWAELIMVAPATADALARTAQGRADDLLAAVILDTTAPVLWAPAMNTRMWENPLTQENVRRLSAVGHRFVGPEAGDLACGEEGQGRLAAVERILAAVRLALVPEGPLAGRRMLITAGPTREPWDAIRFLSNRSSGRMGYALADAARRRGARVTLVAGPTALAAPPGVVVRPVTTAREMYDAVLAEFPGTDVVIAAAAVADYRPAAPAEGKVKKTGQPMQIELVPNPDILLELGRTKTRQLLVGFAAESGEDPLPGARTKLEAKHLDLIVANRAGGPGDAFDAEASAAVLLDARGDVQTLTQRPKPELAAAILDRIEALLV